MQLVRVDSILFDGTISEVDEGHRLAKQIRQVANLVAKVHDVPAPKELRVKHSFRGIEFVSANLGCSIECDPNLRADSAALGAYEQFHNSMEGYSRIRIWTPLSEHPDAVMTLLHEVGHHVMKTVVPNIKLPPLRNRSFKKHFEEYRKERDGLLRIRFQNQLARDVAGLALNELAARFPAIYYQAQAEVQEWDARLYAYTVACETKQAHAIWQSTLATEEMTLPNGARALVHPPEQYLQPARHSLLKALKNLKPWKVNGKPSTIA